MESSNDKFRVERCPVCRGSSYILTQTVTETLCSIIKRHDYVDCPLECDHGFVRVLNEDKTYNMGKIRQDFIHIVMDGAEAKISIPDQSSAHHRQKVMDSHGIDEFERYCVFTMMGGEIVQKDPWIYMEDHQAMLDLEEAGSDWLFDDDEE